VISLRSSPSLNPSAVSASSVVVVSLVASAAASAPAGAWGAPVIDRAIQVHGALGYSTDTPLANMFQHARWARFADGADEVHQWRIAQRTIDAYKRDRSTRTATGNLPL